MNKKLAVIGILAVMLIFTASLAGQAKTYKIGLLDDITTLNLWAGIGPDSTTYNFAVYNYWPTLYSLTDKTFQFVPYVADGMPSDLPPVKSEETTEEGDPLWESTVKLHENYMWQDGTELTAEDVVFSYHTVQEFSDSLGGNWVADLVPSIFYDVEAIDSHTVKFYITEKSAKFKWGILMMGLVQKAKWEPVVEEAKQQENPGKYLLNYDVKQPMSSDSFVFGERQEGAFITNKKNEDWYLEGQETTLYENGTVVDKVPGKYEATYYGEPEGDVIVDLKYGPHVDEVLFKVYKNMSAAVLALQKGDIDFIHNPNGLEKGFADQLRGKEGITLVENQPNGWRYMTFNARKTPYDMINFRKAVANLVDKEFVTQTVLQGVAQPQYSVIPPANTFWYNPDVPKIGRGMDRGARIERAVELLKEAGFSWEKEPVVEDGELTQAGEGLILPSGDKMEQQTLLAPSAGYDPMRATFAIWIERWLNEAGIPVRAKLTGFNTIVQEVFPSGEAPTFDMYILGWGLGNPAFPDFMYDFWHSSTSHPKGFNTTGYSSERFDEAAEKFVGEWDLNQAKEYAYTCQEILAEEVPYVVLFYSPLTEAYRSGRVEFQFDQALDGLQGGYGFQSLTMVIE